MLTQIIGSEQSAMLDLDVSLSWEASVSGRNPSMSFTVTRSSPVWGHAVLDSRGGFLVIVESPAGRFQAIADRPEYVAGGMRFGGIPLHQWLEKNTVGSGQTFRHALAGHIVTAAFRDAIDGYVPLKLGSVLMAPPLVPELKFDGQPVMDVLTELREKTGHEWWIDDRQRLHWGPFQGRFRERWLIDDGLLFERTQMGSLLDESARVTELEPGGGSFTAHDGSVPVLWPSNEVVRL